MKYSFIFCATFIFICTAPAQVNPPTVKIGSQTWMVKNLDVDHYRNGDLIPYVNEPTLWASLTTGAWCYPNNDSSLVTTYGRLYNWYAVNDPRILAPLDWHIPSDAEWTTLGKSLGGLKVAGGKMKEAGTLHWIRSKRAGDNNSGWTGLPGSYCPSGGLSRNQYYSFVGYQGCWWSSSERRSPTNASYTSGAWIRTLYYGYQFIDRDFWNKRCGLSVRCLMD